MIKGYVMAVALGALSTVAAYEGKSALGKSRPSHITADTKLHAAGASGAIEDARQQLADSLIRCQDELQRKNHEEPEGAELSGVAVGSPPELESASAGTEPPAAEEERFDPTVDEWRELAKRGQVKLSRPCTMDKDWEPGEGELQSVGLETKDARTVAEAFRAANARAWESTRGTCAEWLGSDVRVAERIGPQFCESILDEHAQEDSDVFRHVAEIRAGARQESASRGPMERYYLAKTREMKAFEADLTRRVGADRARRITSSTSFCMQREEWPPSERE